jgi:DNA-binding NarL/FixJ family response regulator
MAIGVFIVDDQELLRLGVSALLQAENDIELIGEAALAADALARIQATRPDVVLLDTRLPDGDGVALCRAIRAEPNPPACLLLTAAENDPILLEALDAGAAGYVLKSVHSAELIDAVRKIAAGASLLDASGSDGLLERMRIEAAKSDPLKNLAATDREIVHLIGEGLTNRQIGDRLGLSERTIKNHVSHVLTVLTMERRTQIAVLAASLKPEGTH